jgi:oligosaccharide repeat unit polymerase
MSSETRRIFHDSEVPQVYLSSLKVVLGLTVALTVCVLVVLGIFPVARISTYLLLAASASFLLVGARGNYDLMHPVRVFGALWCFCLALGSMHLLSIISVWGSLMWACVLTGFATFIGGFWIADTLYAAQDISPGFSSARVFRAADLVPNRKTLILAAICVLIGLSVLAYEDFLIGGIPILADNADSLRMELFGGASANPKFDTLFIKLIHPFVEFLKYGVFLAFVVLFQKRPKSKRVILLSALLIVFGTLAYGSQAGRTFFVTIAVGAIILFHYLRRRIRLIEIVSSVVLLFLFIGLSGSMRIRQSQSAPLFEKALENSNLPDGNFWEGVAFGYATTTVSLEVFYRLTEDLKTMQHPPGGFLFYSLHRFLPRTSLGEVATDLYSGESTTSTFLGDFYGDYGYWGVLFGPLLMGFGYGWAYSHTGGHNGLYWIYVRVMLMQMLVFFPYVNLFSLYLTWIFDLFCMYHLVRWTTSDGTDPGLSAANPAGI